MKRSFPQRRPLLFVGLLLLLFLIIFFLAGAITLHLKLSSLTMALMADGVLALIALVLLSRLHWWREAGFHLPTKPHSLWFFAIPCLPIILNMAYFGVSYPGIGRLLLVLAIALLVGFVEESYFRGMMLHGLLRRGPWQAVIISSLCFGIMHLLNLAGGANLAATLLQVVYAVAIGLMYAALALRTQTILPLIVTHALTDFVGFLALNSAVVTGSQSTLFFLVMGGEIIVYTAYSLLLMRQVKQQTRGTDSGEKLIPTPVAV